MVIDASAAPMLRLGRRLAAGVALAALLVSAGMAAILVLDIGLLVFLLLSVAFVVVSIWYALTRRGPLRVVALVGVVAGMSAVVIVGIPTFAVVLVPLLVFGVS